VPGRYDGAQLRCRAVVQPCPTRMCRTVSVFSSPAAASFAVAVHVLLLLLPLLLLLLYPTFLLGGFVLTVALRGGVCACGVCASRCARWGPPASWPAQDGPKLLNAFDVVNMFGGMALNRMLTTEDESKLHKSPQFISAAAPREILERIRRSLVAMECEPKIDDVNFKVKATIRTPKGEISIVVNIYALSDSLRFVEMHRGKGDLLEYNRWVPAEARFSPPPLPPRPMRPAFPPIVPACLSLATHPLLSIVLQRCLLRCPCCWCLFSNPVLCLCVRTR
jgi:hypothetical protein